jgi:hypothetical protein
MAAPAGTYRVRAIPSNNNLPYVDEWFNDTTNRDLAYTVPVTLLSEFVADFSLMISNLAYTAWRNHYFTTSDLADVNISGDDADPDKDGANNLEEYLADTHPRGSNSVLRVTRNIRSGGGLRIEWKGGRWARQYIQRSEALNASGDGWTDIHTNDTLPTGATNFVLDADAAHPALFYRIKVDR